MSKSISQAWLDWRVARKLRSGKPLQGPHWVHLGITDGCNYHCSMCATHSRLLPPQGYTAMLPRQVFDELLEDLRLLGTRLAEFGVVGESLVHPEAMRMIRATKEAGLEVLLVTNGSLLTRDICDELVDLGVETINVSLNAASDETHERLNGARRGDRARILAMLRHLRRARHREHDGKPASRTADKPFLSVSTVVHKESYREILPFAQQAIHLDVDHVFFAPLGVNQASAQLVMTPEEDAEARDLVAAADAALRAIGKQTNAAAFLDRSVAPYWTRDLYSRIPCYIGQIFSRVLGTGDVYPCAASRHRSLGNLATTRFRDIWYSETYRQFRREALALPRRREQVRGCRCWTCGQHFLIKQYRDKLRLGQVQLPPKPAIQPRVITAPSDRRRLAA